MSRERLAPVLIGLLVLVVIGAAVVAAVLATRGDDENADALFGARFEGGLTVVVADPGALSV